MSDKLNELRTDKGLLVAEIDDKVFQKILSGAAGKWVIKEYVKSGPTSVYEITEDSTLTAGGGAIKLCLWEGFYIEPHK